MGLHSASPFNADWLILIASPEAAASKWVKREIHFWLGDKLYRRTGEEANFYAKGSNILNFGFNALVSSLH